MFGIPRGQLARLQSLQNAAARLVSHTSKFDHITPVLKDLHWLPLEARINLKIILLTFKIIHGHAPIYLRDLLELYAPVRDLLFSDKLCLIKPRGNFNKTYAQRASSVCGPILWNDLP